MTYLFFHLRKNIRNYGLIVGLFFTQLNSAAQSFSWAKQMGGVSASASPNMGQIRFDASGNSYHSIACNGTVDVDPGPGILNMTNTRGIIKLDPSGNLLWAKAIAPNRFVLDPAGNLYTVGNFTGTQDFDPGAGVYNLTSFGFEDVYIAKYDASGEIIWAKQVGGAYKEQGLGIVATSQGLFITGSFGYGGNVSPINSCDFDPDPTAVYNLNNLGNWDGFVLSLNLDGQFISVKQKGTVNEDHVSHIDADAAGNIYYFYRSHLLHYLEKAGQNLDIVWTKNIPALEHAPLSVDALGNILLSGGYSGTVDFDPGPGVTSFTSSTVQDPYVVKFDANGNFNWVRVIKANGFANGNITDSEGNVYTVGYFNAKGNVDFDPGQGVFSLKVSAVATYVQKLNSSGNFVWAVKMGGESRTNSRGRSIGINNTSAVITALEFNGKIDVNPGSVSNYLTSIGALDIGIVSMTQTGSMASSLWVSEKPVAEDLISYPNPSNGAITLSLPRFTGQGNLMIFDAGGRLVWIKTLPANGQKIIPIANIGRNGVYLIVLRAESKTYTSRLVIQ